MLVNVPAAGRASRGRSTSRTGLTQSQHRKLRASRRRCSCSHRGPERLPDVNTGEITTASCSRDPDHPGPRPRRRARLTTVRRSSSAMTSPGAMLPVPGAPGRPGSPAAAAPRSPARAHRAPGRAADSPRGQPGSVNRGGRWPNSAATASAWFGLPMRAPISSCSAAKPVSRSARPARSSSRLAARMACGLQAGDDAGQLQGGLPRVRIDPGRQAERHGLLAAHDPPGEGQLLGDVPAHQLREQLAARSCRAPGPT